MMKLIEGVLKKEGSISNVAHFTDISKCKAWLSTLPLTNAREANNALTQQLIALAANSLPSLRMLEILETLLPVVGFVQNEYEKKFAAKALPLNPNEQPAFDEVCVLWQHMGQAYASVMMSNLDTDGKIKTLLPLICERSLSCCISLMKVHYRAHKQLDPSLWHQLHGYYEIAEVRRFIDVEIAEHPGSHHKITTCKAAYAEALLLDIASPYNMSSREFDICCRWTKRWAHKLRITLAPEDPDAPGYAVDLFGQDGPQHVKFMEIGDSLRYLGSSRLSTSLLRYIKKLSQGENPVELGLGEDCTQPSCQQLMEHLYKQWCIGRSDRRFERHTATYQTQACTGFQAIYHLLHGSPFDQPSHARSYDHKDVESIYMFRQFANPTNRLSQSNIMFAIETWDMLDQSATGFHLRRSGSGGRIAHEQLIIIRLPDTGQFLLCEVRRLLQDNTGALDIGVEILPGVPHEIAVRITGINVSVSQKYSPAFILEANAAMKADATLVIPLGWYQPGRILEVYRDGMVRVTLNTLVSRGADYDRVTFSAATK